MVLRLDNTKNELVVSLIARHKEAQESKPEIPQQLENHCGFAGVLTVQYRASSHGFYLTGCRTERLSYHATDKTALPAAVFTDHRKHALQGETRRVDGMLD